MKKYWILVMAAAMVAGCFSGTKEAAVTPSPSDGVVDHPFTGGGTSGSSPDVSASRDSNSKPAPTGEKRADGTVLPRASDKIPEPPKVKVDIPKPNTRGWGNSDLGWEQLADKVASTMNGLKGVYGEATIILDNGQMSGTVTCHYRIRGKDEFAIEFNLPLKPNETGRYIANASKGRAMFESGEWKPIPAAESGKVVERWPMNFPREIFSGLVLGHDTWKPFLMGLSRGESGYKATLEMRTVTPRSGDLPQKYYRVSAVRSSPRAEEIEIRFDAVYFLPLAIRVKADLGKGKKLETQWQARWSSQVALKDEDFKLPRAM